MEKEAVLPQTGNPAQIETASQPQDAGAATGKTGVGKAAGVGDVVSALTSAGTSAEREISVSTVARMMGLATVADLKLIGSKVDLVLGRVNAIAARMEKVLSVLNQAPTGSDLERIDLQIGGLKAMIRESLLVGSGGIRDGAEKEDVTPED